MIRTTAATAALGLAVLVMPGRAAEPRWPAASDAGAVTPHVVVISIDGLRPDAIADYDARVLQRLMAEGSYSLSARTITPSRTLPSHTSMLTGVPPAVHGITWNTDRTGETGAVEVQTVFEAVKIAGFSTAAFFSKSKLKHLNKPGTLDHAQAPTGLSVFSAAETVEQAARYIRYRRPNLVFVHLAEPDAAGHSIGWMSFAYGWAVRRADGAVGEILEAADDAYGEGNYSVIVTSDHGGHGRSHGDDSDADMQIPWIAWGAGVLASGQLDGLVRTVDTAATVLWLLGVRSGADLHGRPVVSAYTPEARLAAGATISGL
ncbi:MAG: ectonucleotide pyrophosphatase/phosphodiesterase [Gemmatimonadota bacterium]